MIETSKPQSTMSAEERARFVFVVRAAALQTGRVGKEYALKAALEIEALASEVSALREENERQGDLIGGAILNLPPGRGWRAGGDLRTGILAMRHALEAAESALAKIAEKDAALRDLLTEARYKGLIYWWTQTTRGAVAKADMLARIDAALSDSQPSAAADAYCVTTSDGGCVSTDPRCMHQPRPAADDVEGGAR